MVIKLKGITCPYDRLVAHCRSERCAACWHQTRRAIPGVRLVPLVRGPEAAAWDRLVARARRRTRQRGESFDPCSLQYLAITCPPEVEPEVVANRVACWPAVELAYVEEGPAPPPVELGQNEPLRPEQGYLDPAPQGVDAESCWSLPGGRGEGIRLIDLEEGWGLNHEELRHLPDRRPITGVNFAFFAHGTAVLAAIVAPDNGLGIIGLAPRLARVQLASPRAGYASRWRNVGAAIVVAAAHLRRGDILLVEAQTASGYPIELQSLEFHAIRTATAAGIVVIEPAGNGGHRLDDFSRHGESWFDRSRRDSGAILVAAASRRTPHRRLPFSCYGHRVDCYAWGEAVVAAGQKTQSIPASDSYRRDFRGTSAAAAIVAGVAGLVQARARRVHGRPYGPAQLRQLLGDPRWNTPGAQTNEGIGVMPNLKALVNQVLTNQPAE